MITSYTMEKYMQCKYENEAVHYMAYIYVHYYIKIYRTPIK